MKFKDYKLYKGVSGIYKIQNIRNNKVYIGSTVNLLSRYRSHLYGLRYERHGNTHLTNAWNKYGETSFEFIVLELVPDISNLIEREQSWIDYFPRNMLYNIVLSATSTLALSTHSIAIPVIQIDKQGNIVARFSSVHEAARTTQISNNNIARVIYGRGLSAGNYLWVREDEYDPNINYKDVYLDRQSRNEENRKSPVQQLCPITRKVIGSYSSFTEAVKATGVNGGSINNSCCTNQKGGGFYWRYTKT